jgi:hypothetical protein
VWIRGSRQSSLPLVYKRNGLDISCTPFQWIFDQECPVLLTTCQFSHAFSWLPCGCRRGLTPCSLGLSATSQLRHQPTVLFSQNKSASTNQPAILFSQNKLASATSQTNRLSVSHQITCTLNSLQLWHFSCIVHHSSTELVKTWSKKNLLHRLYLLL